MHPLLGYVDRWSVKPGGTIRLMVSSRDGVPFEARFARIQCGDPNPRGPGYREHAMAHPLTGSHPGKDQRTHLGSWVEVPALDLARAGDKLVICATIWPTLPAKGRQALVSWVAADGSAMSLEIDGGCACAVVTIGGRSTRVATGKKLLDRAWYDVWLVIDRATGTLSVGQRARELHPKFEDEGTGSTALPAGVTLRAGRACLAALAPSTLTAKPSCHYNGKLERPTIWGGTMIEAALGQQRGAVPRSGDPGLVACWDFAIGMDTLTVTDVGPGGCHGRTQNMPTRAMTGASWSGAEHRWTHRPQEWGAIHFHDDDLGDVGWTPSLEIRIPDDWPSGLYAVHLKSANGFDNVPFIVRPGAASPKAKVAILLPTVSYHVYGNFVRPGWGRR
ncbi:MAG: N,N-dimethylformamidase, partial [Alphaproteobacteria bacterium]|nr:N,N-dimethylformamidase [Alphaproteobacteria bacterium]